MNFLLDTHVWIWWAARPEKLSYKAREILINGAGDHRLLLSTISLWEFCKLVEKKRLKLSCSPGEWIMEALRLPGLETVPITPETAWDSTSLPDCPVSDPADQIITAAARTTGAVLITADSSLLAYPHVRTLW